MHVVLRLGAGGLSFVFGIVYGTWYVFLLVMRDVVWFGMTLG